MQPLIFLMFFFSLYHRCHPLISAAEAGSSIDAYLYFKLKIRSLITDMLSRLMELIITGSGCGLTDS